MASPGGENFVICGIQFLLGPHCWAQGRWEGWWSEAGCDGGCQAGGRAVAAPRGAGLFWPAGTGRVERESGRAQDCNFCTKDSKTKKGLQFLHWRFENKENFSAAILT